jgi:hypothetical protein
MGDAKQPETGNNIKLPAWINENVLLAVAPVVAYFIAFAFQQSYCDAFGIPLFLADVNTTTIFTYTSLILASWYVIISAVEGISAVFDDKWHKAVSSYFLFLSFFSIVFILEEAEFTFRVKILFFLFAFTYVIDFLSAWLATGADKQLPFPQRFMGLHRYLPSNQNYPLLNHPTGKKIVVFLWSALAIYYISVSLGDYAAKREREFLVSNTDPTLILVTVRGETAICSRYDIKTKKILRELEIRPLSELHDFTEKDLGRLDFGR